MIDAPRRRRIVDAHQHFWDLDHNHHPWLQESPPRSFRYGDTTALRRNYLPADYRRDAADLEVVATVYVEAEWSADDPVGEQTWLARLKTKERLPTVSVAQAWLARPDVAETLAAEAAFPFVRGVRQKPRAALRAEDARRGATGSMDDPHWRAGFALLEQYGFSFDLQAPFWHADAAAALARDFPRTPIIINHTFLPSDRSEEGLAAWRRALSQVAAAPNVMLKISGLGLPGRPWDAQANRPVIRDAIAAFGTERTMFASNYPVDRLVGPFSQIFAGFMAAVAGMPAAIQDALFEGNARRIYRIPN